MPELRIQMVNLFIILSFIVNQVEFGRGQGRDKRNAREGAAHQAVDALHERGYY
jgi:dsRNA-specific ribonuclease